MRSKKYLLILIFLGSSYLTFGQDMKNEDYGEDDVPQLILKTNILSVLGGNSSLNISAEFPLNRHHSFELDLNYFLPLSFIDYRKGEELKRFDIEPLGGYGIYLSYKEMLLLHADIQMFFGFHVGYRHIKYRQSRWVCTEVDNSGAASGICPCTNLINNTSGNISRGYSGGFNLGFQPNFFIKERKFFWGFNTVIGIIRYNPKLDNYITHTTCLNLLEAVEEQEQKYISNTNNIFTNGSIQVEDGLEPFLLIQLKLGHVF